MRGIKCVSNAEMVELIKERGTSAICIQHYALGDTFEGIPATPIKRLSQIPYLLDFEIKCVCIPGIFLFRRDKSLLPALKYLVNEGYEVVITLRC